MTYLWLNVVTGSRLLCGPVWLWCWWKRPRGMVLWMVLDFAWFVASDWWDGTYAREHRLDSDLGAVLDHGADVLFYGAIVCMLLFGSREADAERRKRRSPPTDPSPPPEAPVPPAS